MQANFSRLVTALFAVIAMLALPGRASAHDVPHFARGSAQFISNNDFVGTGRATHLGLYTEVGHVSFVPTSNPGVLAVTGTTIYIAANGDELHAAVSGELDTSTGEITATVTYVGGTGRFVNATGSSSLTGQMLGGGALRVAVAGNINF